MALNYYNYITLLRHIAAIMVIYAHSFELMSTSSTEYFKSLFGLDLGYLAVNIFFFLSGMLIYNSAKNSVNLKSYFMKRFLRIYPALLICIVFTTFIFWIDSSYSFVEYLSSNITINYILNLLLIGKYTAYEIFDSNYYSHVANGSLWTLRYEFIMYVISSIFVFSYVNKNKYILYIIFLMFFILYASTINNDKSIITNMARLGSYFFIGALLSNYSLLNIKKYLFATIILLSIGLILLFNYKYIFIFIIVSLVFKYSLDYIKSIESNKQKIDFDISYGLYIYAFPIQQFLIKYIEYENVYSYFINSLIFTSLFAIISWLLIEKQALKLKNDFR